MKILLVATLTLVAVTWTVDGLSCRPTCDKSTCIKPGKCFAFTESGKRINLGKTLDECGCCKVCRQGPGEKCKGPFNIHGKCGKKLYCQIDPEFEKDDPNASGICILKKKKKECPEGGCYGRG